MKKLNEKTWIVIFGVIIILALGYIMYKENNPKTVEVPVEVVKQVIITKEIPVVVETENEIEIIKEKFIEVRINNESKLEEIRAKLDSIKESLRKAVK